MKLNYRRTFLIGLAFLSISAFWQMYDNIIPLMLQGTFGLGETVTGFIMAADNVLALFLLPIFGSLSDKVDTPMGKRMPFIVGGTLLAVFFLMLLPSADKSANIVFFIVSLFALLIAMGLYRSPAVALMPDLTPNRLRSKGNAIINLMGAVGGVYTLLMIKLLVGKGEHPDYLPLFASVAALMVVTVGILALTIREKKVKALVEAQVKAYGDPESAAAQDPGESKAAFDEEKYSESQGRTSMPGEVKRSMAFFAGIHFSVVYGLQCGDHRLFPLYESGVEPGGRRLCRLPYGSDGGSHCQLYSHWKYSEQDRAQEDDSWRHCADERLLFCGDSRECLSPGN